MRVLAAAVTLIGILMALPAAGATYRFDVDTDAVIDGQPLGPYHFFLDSSPVPARYDDDGFTVYAPTYLFNETFSRNSIYTFYTGQDDGGLEEYVDYYAGDVLFDGPTDHPTFFLGTFMLSEFDARFGQGGTLTISAVGTTGAVPEPTAWAMLVAGFGLVGGRLRRGRHTLVA